MVSSLLSFILKTELNHKSHSDAQLLTRNKCFQTYTSCLWKPWQPKMLCGCLWWESSGHMVFDYWRWRVRLLSARCVVLSEAETRVKAHHWSLTHANELILLNMHQASPSGDSDRGVNFAEIMGMSHFPLCQMSSDLRETHVWPMSEQFLTIFHTELYRYFWLLSAVTKTKRIQESALTHSWSWIPESHSSKTVSQRELHEIRGTMSSTTVQLISTLAKSQEQNSRCRSH